MVLADAAPRQFDALQSAAPVGAVNLDEPRVQHGLPEDRDTKQLSLGYHTDGDRQRLKKDWNIIVTLVIAHHHVGLASGDVLAPTSLDDDARPFYETARPRVQANVTAAVVGAVAHGIPDRGKANFQRFEGSGRQNTEREHGGTKSMAEGKRQARSTKAAPPQCVTECRRDVPASPCFLTRRHVTNARRWTSPAPTAPRCTPSASKSLLEGWFDSAARPAATGLSSTVGWRQAPFLLNTWAGTRHWRHPPLSKRAFRLEH